MKYTLYEYPITDGDTTYMGSFTLKENPSHPEIIEELGAHEVETFEA